MLLPNAANPNFGHLFGRRSLFVQSARIFLAALALHGTKFANGAVPGALNRGLVAAQSIEIPRVTRHADGDSLVIVDRRIGIDLQTPLEGVEVIFEGGGFDATAAQQTPIVLRNLVGEAMF